MNDVNSRTKKLHQVATVRLREGVSTATAARKMGVPRMKIKDIEDEFTDLPLSVLYRWSKALNVPMSELLLTSDKEESTGPLEERGKLVQLMKTVELMREMSSHPPVLRLVNNARSTLLHIMPELAEVRPWPKYGAPRANDEASPMELRVIREAWLEDAL